MKLHVLRNRNTRHSVRINRVLIFESSKCDAISVTLSLPPRLRVVPHFSSEMVERAKRERAWKSPHARKGDTWREGRKMRDYRQSPSFWPFTADWFWSVKFVSPSKSIKRIQWDSFPYWAVIALVIGKLRGIFIASKKKTQILIFFTAVSREELDSVGNTRL